MPLARICKWRLSNQGIHRIQQNPVKNLGRSALTDRLIIPAPDQLKQDG